MGVSYHASFNMQTHDLNHVYKYRPACSVCQPYSQPLLFCRIDNSLNVAYVQGSFLRVSCSRCCRHINSRDILTHIQLVTVMNNDTVMYTSYCTDEKNHMRQKAMLNCVNKTYRGNAYFAGICCTDNCGDKFKHVR